MTLAQQLAHRLAQMSVAAGSGFAASLAVFPTTEIRSLKFNLAWLMISLLLLVVQSKIQGRLHTVIMLLYAIASLPALTLFFYLMKIHDQDSLTFFSIFTAVCLLVLATRKK